MRLPVDELHLRGESLVAKFEQGDGTSYIDEAIVLARKALKLSPPGHPKRHVSMLWRETCLSKRYDQLGGMTDLEEVIVLGRDTLALSTEGHHIVQSH